jgi:hypothetical protein
MAAGQINTIGPSIAVPEVPTGPRVSVNSDLAQGLLDFARGVDRVAKAQSLYAEEMRQHREAAAADPDTDYARKTTEFRKKAAAAREKLVSDPKTAPQSEAERQAFDRDADAIETGMARDVERSGFEQAVPAIRERLFGDLDKLSRDAVLDVAGTADKHMRMVAVENIRRHVEAGILKAGEAPRVLQAFDAAVQEAGVRKLAGGDPAAAAAALGEDGAYPSIGAARRQQLVEEFDVAARTRQAETDGELDNALKELNSAFHDSRVPGAELVANLRRLAADSGNEKAAIAADAADAGLSFARKLGRMPVEDGVKLWTTLRDGKETGPARDAALAFGAAQLRDMDRQLKSDPLAFATAQGFADVEPLDFMQATPDHLVQRAKTARMVQAFYRLPDTQFLTGDERQSLGAAFKAADPSRKLALVGSITGAFGGPSAGKLLREIDGIVPAESHLATLSLHGGGREATARRGFEGQRAIADKAVTLPAESEFARVEGAQIGAMLDVRLTNTRAAIIGAARALYAERAVSRGLTDFDPFEYTKALQEAAGKGSDGGGNRHPAWPQDPAADGHGPERPQCVTGRHNRRRSHPACRWVQAVRCM